METLQTVLTIGFLIGVVVFILPLFGEMLFEAIGLLIEMLEYGGMGKKKQ